MSQENKAFLEKITFGTPRITITTKQDFDSMENKDPTQLYAINDGSTIYIGNTLLYGDGVKLYDGTVSSTYGYSEPKYKLRKCECCGGPLKGTTCGWCGAEYEVYY